MAIIEANTAGERTMREAIDTMLLKVASLARENNQAARRLRGVLLSAPPENPTPERQARLGWLGEIADALESATEHLEDTAKTLEEVFQQVATQMPTAAEPRR